MVEVLILDGHFQNTSLCICEVLLVFSFFGFCLLSFSFHLFCSCLLPQRLSAKRLFSQSGILLRVPMGTSKRTKCFPWSNHLWHFNTTCLFGLKLQYFSASSLDERPDDLLPFNQKSSFRIYFESGNYCSWSLKRIIIHTWIYCCFLKNNQPWLVFNRQKMKDSIWSLWLIFLIFKWEWLQACKNCNVCITCYCWVLSVYLLCRGGIVKDFCVMCLINLEQNMVPL